MLHCVDEAKHFQSASILRNMKSESVWKALLICWSLIYLCPPDFLRVDQGSNLVSEEFKYSAHSQRIEVLEALTESSQTLSYVERYRSQPQSAFMKIKSCTKGISDDDIFRMALKSGNDTTGPKGLWTTLLVFGAIPKTLRKISSPTQQQRSIIIDKAMEEVQQIYAKSRVQLSLRHVGQKGGERTDLDSLFPGSKVLICRNESKHWEGPFTFIDKEGQTVCLQMPQWRRIFKSTLVKPTINPTSDVQNMDTALNIFEVEENVSIATEQSEGNNLDLQMHVRKN